MAPDVSFVLQTMMMNKNGKDDGSVKSPAAPGVSLVTKDLLGTSDNRVGTNTELNLDLKAPFGWEKRLDMESGEVYLQRCATVVERHTKKVEQDLNFDLNFPPSTSALSLWWMDESVSFPAATLDLTLNLPSTTSSSNSPANSNLSFVCTLDKVRSALERVRKHAHQGSPSLGSSSLSPEKALSEEETAQDQEECPSGRSLFAAACPSCLLYVLICSRNPKCPRCDAVVPLPSSSPSPTKKRRLDLSYSVI